MSFDCLSHNEHTDFLTAVEPNATSTNNLSCASWYVIVSWINLCSHSVELIFEYRDKRTNNDIWILAQKTEDWATQTPLKSGSEKKYSTYWRKLHPWGIWGEITKDFLLLNLLIYILQWVIWKARNYIKYNQNNFRESIVLSNCKKGTQK